MEDVFSNMEDVFFDMDVDPPEFHSSCAFTFPEPMDVDPPSINPKDEPMDVDTPPAVLELSTLFDALTFADSSTVEPDADIDSHLHPHPDHMAVVLYNPGDQAVVLYNQQNKDSHHDKAVVLYDRNRSGVESLLDSLPLISPADGYEINQLIEKFSQLAIKEDDDDDDDDGPNPILPSSSVPTAHVPPATEDIETKIPTSGSLHLFSNIELPIDNSNITYICAKCRACSEGKISEYIVEEVSLTDVDDTASESATLFGDSDCVVEEISLIEFATESDIPPILDQTSSKTALTDITRPSSPSLDTPIPCTPLRTPDRLYSERHATHTRGLRNRRMVHPYQRPQPLRTIQADGSSKWNSLPPCVQHSTSSKGKNLDCVVVAKVDDGACVFPTLGHSHTDTCTDTGIPLENKNIPRTPDRIYTEMYTTSPQSRPPRTRKIDPHRRPQSIRTTDDFLENLSHQNVQCSISSAPKASQTPPSKAANIIKSDNDPVIPGAYPGRELEEFESVYLNRPRHSLQNTGDPFPNGFLS